MVSPRRLLWTCLISLWSLGGSAGVSHWKMDSGGNVVAVEEGRDWGPASGPGPLIRAQLAPGIVDRADHMLMRLSYNLENARHRDGSKPVDPSATAQPADDVAADDATSGRPTKVTKPKPTKSRSNKSAGGGGSGGSAASADPSKPAISPVLEFDDTDGDTLVVAPETAISYLDKLEEEMQAFDVPSILSCGNAVTTTRFDHLSGVQERGTIPQYAEKDVYSSIFPMNSAANLEILRTSNLFDLLKNNAELNNRLEAKRGMAELYNALGQLFRVRGNTTGAIDCFRVVLGTDTTNEDALLNLCDTLFRLEKWTEAEEVIRYSLSLEAHREIGQNHFALGRTLLAQGRNGEAVASFKECLRLNPNHHTAQAGLAVSRSLASSRDSNFYTMVIIGCCIVITLFIVYNMMLVSPKPLPNDGADSRPRGAAAGLRGTRSKAG